MKAGVQQAVRFRAFVYESGELKAIDGTTPCDFRKLPDFPALTLGVKLQFSDGTARTVSGWSWIYCVSDPNGWTIDDGPDANVLLLKYPRAVFKPGGTVPERVMQAVNKLLREAE